MTKSKGFLPTAVLAAAVLSGCAGQRIVPMQDAAASRIKSTDVIVVLPQQEIKTEITQSNVAQATGGGLIPALIDLAVNKSRADDAETTVVGVRNALLDYDFSKQILTNIEQQLRQLAWINLQAVRLETTSADDKINDAVARSTANAVLVVRTSYSVTADFLRIKVTALVTGHPKTDELVAVAKQARPDIDPPLLYRNTFIVSNGAGGPFANRDAAAKAWADDNGKKAREALDQGAADLAERLATDLERARARARAAEAAATAPGAPAPAAPATESSGR